MKATKPGDTMTNNISSLPLVYTRGAPPQSAVRNRGGSYEVMNKITYTTCGCRKVRGGSTEHPSNNCVRGRSRPFLDDLN